MEAFRASHGGVRCVGHQGSSSQQGVLQKVHLQGCLSIVVSQICARDHGGAVRSCPCVESSMSKSHCCTKNPSLSTATCALQEMYWDKQKQKNCACQSYQLCASVRLPRQVHRHRPRLLYLVQDHDNARERNMARLGGGDPKR